MQLADREPFVQGSVDILGWAFGLLVAAAPTLQFISTSELSARTRAAPPARWTFSLIDARTRVEFEEGHIPGAVNVPAARARTQLPKIAASKKRELVFYCNGPKCTKSQQAARTALAMGYEKVLEYNEGLPAWGKAQLPIEGAPLPDAESAALSPEAAAAQLAAPGGPLFVDVRDVSEYRALHLSGSLNMPLDDVQERFREVPKGRAVCVVDHSGHQGTLAARLFTSLGVGPISRLDGGILAWQQKGLPLVTGP